MSMIVLLAQVACKNLEKRRCFDRKTNQIDTKETKKTKKVEEKRIKILKYKGSRVRLMIRPVLLRNLF